MSLKTILAMLSLGVCTAAMATTHGTGGSSTGGTDTASPSAGTSESTSTGSGSMSASAEEGKAKKMNHAKKKAADKMEGDKDAAKKDEPKKEGEMADAKMEGEKKPVHHHPKKHHHGAPVGSAEATAKADMAERKGDQRNVRPGEFGANHGTDNDELRDKTLVESDNTESPAPDKKPNA